jgi:hypothetical protein
MARPAVDQKNRDWRYGVLVGVSSEGVSSNPVIC